MKRRWDEVQYAAYVPEELRRRIGQTPVYMAGKVQKFSERSILVYGLLVALLAAIMFGIALADRGDGAAWGFLILRVVVGLLLSWAAWGILSYWHRQRCLRAECKMDYRENGSRCDARVVFFEMQGIAGDTWSPDSLVYYQFRDDFIIHEQLDDNNSGKLPKEGDTVPVLYLRRDPRISRLATGE